jgi:hypothetical protein
MTSTFKQPPWGRVSLLKMDQSWIRLQGKDRLYRSQIGWSHALRMVLTREKRAARDKDHRNRSTHFSQVSSQEDRLET